MWYKIEDIETKYNISKFSIYALITKDQNLRQHIKAIEGTLQIDEKGVEIISKHFKDKKNNSKSMEKIINYDNKNNSINDITKKESDFIEKIKEEDKKEEIKKNNLKLEEEFFTHTSLEREQDFFANKINENEKTPIETIVEEGVNEIAMVKEMSNIEDFNSIDMQAYIKALKEKMIINNEQIRAINNIVEISKKLLLQDEKIINILEKKY